jgi:hypothetical protein
MPNGSALLVAAFDSTEGGLVLSAYPVSGEDMTVADGQRDLWLLAVTARVGWGLSAAALRAVSDMSARSLSLWRVRPGRRAKH